MRSPSLAENWFVEDASEEIGRMPKNGREAIEAWLKRMFGGETLEEGLRQQYRMSRSIRIQRIMAGDFAGARNAGDMRAVEVASFIGYFVDVACDNVTAHVSPSTGEE